MNAAGIAAQRMAVDREAADRGAVIPARRRCLRAVSEVQDRPVGSAAEVKHADRLTGVNVAA